MDVILINLLNTIYPITSQDNNTQYKQSSAHRLAPLFSMTEMMVKVEVAECSLVVAIAAAAAARG